MTILSFPTIIGAPASGNTSPTYPVARNPQMKFLRQEAVSGKETRIQLWTYPRRTWEFAINFMGAGSFSGMTNTDWQTVEGFWLQLGGGVQPFHFNDPNDNAVTLQPIGTGDGTTRTFIFVRTLGGFVEPTPDVTAVSQVTIAGTPSAAYTLVTDPNYGFVYAINFNSAPANGAALKASFTYNWPCRFEDDTIEFSRFMSNAFEARKITLKSIKVP